MSEDMKKEIEKGPELKLETDEESTPVADAETNEAIMAELEELQSYPVKPTASANINIDEKQFNEEEQKMIDDFVDRI
ncbi:MAG: hypothetical protein J6D18_01410, partial [Erysipelotrichaceae bacterium]|nr:hypothetical protein [Erysipelotrichaceae bacterium]